jgi:glycosyltransferase involved in cell wall biosynthesis
MLPPVVFLTCYNESTLLPHTIHHYKTYLPSCRIIIFDNQSTDNSVEIATSLGCICIEWNTNNKTDEFKLRLLKNNCWKKWKRGWIIVADMDEWLCVTENELLEEMQKGTTILRVDGKNMIGESKRADLTDIDLHSINKYVDAPGESKNLCFLRERILQMNYRLGAHRSDPEGFIRYSTKIYTNKHMVYLGLDYYTQKTIARFKRSEEMRQMGIDIHYSDDIGVIIAKYNEQLSNYKLLE